LVKHKSRLELEQDAWRAKEERVKAQQAELAKQAFAR